MIAADRNKKNYGQAAWADLVAQYECIRLYLDRRRSRDMDVHQLVQETYLRALGAAEARGPPRDPRNWLFKIARCTLADAYRLQKRASSYRYLESEEECVAPEEDDPLATLQRQDERRYLDSKLAQLRKSDRKFLVDHHVHGKRIREIARSAKISPTAVKMRLYRARLRLRKVSADLGALSRPLRGNHGAGPDGSLR